MKVSELWLRSLINPPLPATAIADQLTRAGIEVDSITPAGKEIQNILALKVPTNRGDCLSLEGLARELSVLNNMPYHSILVAPAPTRISDTLPVYVERADLCPRYVGCVIKNSHNQGTSPTWLTERLEAGGIRSVSTLVDIINYVMLELGQPLHAFDLTKLNQAIVVRLSKPGEQITLLDNQTIRLIPGTLVIADKNALQAIAGVMGGLKSAVVRETTALWVESAYFDPVTIRLIAKQVGLRTEASHRFERGIDPTLQRRALERVQQLVVEIAGGDAGPIIEQKNEAYLPKIPIIFLRKDRISKILGTQISDPVVLNILQRLGMQVTPEPLGFRVSPPTFRGDITQEIDLIEEVARIYGLHRLGKNIPTTILSLPFVSETAVSPERFKTLLVDRGYSEIISYSFIDPKWFTELGEETKPLTLSNPIAADMASMRMSLWPGLLQAVHYNHCRKQHRTRFFEMGACFLRSEEQIIEMQRLGGVIAGSLYKEQWGTPLRTPDFYDIKSDVEALCALVDEKAFTIEKAEHASLHPGQTVRILRAGNTVGYAGVIHPRILKAFKLEGPLMVFELDMAYLQNAKIPSFQPLSKFPAIRRDIAILVDKAFSATELRSAIAGSAGAWLQEIILFDVYQGKGIAPTQKSVALGLILQHPSRTLVEEEINKIVQGILTMLTDRFEAVLRE